MQTFLIGFRKKRRISDKMGRIVAPKVSIVSPVPAWVGGDFASIFIQSGVGPWKRQEWEVRSEYIPFDAVKRAFLKPELWTVRKAAMHAKWLIKETWVTKLYTGMTLEMSLSNWWWLLRVCRTESSTSLFLYLKARQQMGIEGLFWLWMERIKIYSCIFKRLTYEKF